MKPKTMNLKDLTTYLNDYLQIAEYVDSSKNGLQIQGPNDVQRVAFAVDSSLAGFEEAVEREADLLIVHHGLFWGRERVLTETFFERVKTLIQGHVGLYAAHIPLDGHAEVGNNAELARALGLEISDRFGDYKGMPIGVAGRPSSGSIQRDDLVQRIDDRLDTKSVVQPYGADTIRRIAIVSGGAADMIGEAAAAGFDLFLTGETNHIHAHAAEEHAINVVFAGHYATETVGLKALARHVEDKFGLETTFIDLPTGM